MGANAVAMTFQVRPDRPGAAMRYHLVLGEREPQPEAAGPAPIVRVQRKATDIGNEVRDPLPRAGLISLTGAREIIRFTTESVRERIVDVKRHIGAAEKVDHHRRERDR